MQDQGPGISEEILPKIFDPYFTTKESGNGLGLASCYSIITGHGGIIGAESQAGRGATFTFYVPVSNKQPEKEAPSPTVPTLRAKVLIMDDEQAVRKTIQKMLEQIGCRVETAADGAAAIDRYRAAKEAGRPFDLVIFDLTVPGGLGGKRALQKLKQIDPHVKAIVASGYSHNPVMANPTRYGFQGVISKPFTLKDIGRAIDNALTQAT